MFSFLSSRNFIIFTALLLSQGAAGYYLNTRQEYLPPVVALALLPPEEREGL